MSTTLHDQREDADASGSCLCSAVQFAIPLPVKWVAHCHCTRCQRAHGAAFVTWVGVEQTNAHIQDEQGALAWYVVPEGGSRGFCSRCGSPLFFKSARYPGELHIARAAFKDSLAQLPQSHVFFDTHVDWVSIADVLAIEPDPE